MGLRLLSTEKTALSLVSVEDNTSVKVVKISGGHHVIHRLKTLGIEPGQYITKIKLTPMQGPCVIQKGSTILALGYGIAKKIIVQLLHEKDSSCR